MMSSSPVWIFDHIKAFDFGLKGISSRLVLKQSVLEQSIAPTCTQRLVKNFFFIFTKFSKVKPTVEKVQSLKVLLKKCPRKY